MGGSDAAGWSGDRGSGCVIADMVDTIVADHDGPLLWHASPISRGSGGYDYCNLL